MLLKALHRFERFSAPRVGVVAITLLVLFGVTLFQKTQITTFLSPGDDMTVAFDRDYQLRSHVTKVKVAGVPVGIVTDVEHRKDGTAVATLHLEKGVKDKLRSDPGAVIRPTTLLGGNYYVELSPGGDPGEVDAIGVDRTTTPVELDRVLEVLKPEARTSTQRTVRRLDALLDEPGRDAIHGLVDDAPATLRPLGTTLKALRGKSKGDLRKLVSSLDDTARTLNDNRDSLDAALAGLSDVSSTLAASAPDVAAAVDDLPQTLRATRAGLGALDHSLGELRDVSDDAVPTAERLSTTLRALDPALRELRPVLRDLRPALADLRPVVDDLVPSAVDATRVLNDVDGPTLDRIKGPIVEKVNSDWHGTGEYAKGGNDTVFYKELGDLIAGMNNAGRMTDRNGSTIHFQPGFGLGSVSNLPISLEQLMMQLAYPQGAP
ncbi:phospholipid/cholesterol/gamma-HCH transport system substrate-binding protein [Nocardioides sp. J9]|uniref:MlaD family protein n=1 Tax=Nocardioides sp. J9 TaxID=935844 RepID=UPI0011A0F62C|nr:MlaD family protein [Nocardioides sp. J9]TWH00870.1 phospholipid/cholesterol/gamma-HCH transport system substrate-binding protein [Nocardioides sp. J9]